MVSPFPLSPELQAFEAKPQMWMFYILCLNSIKKNRSGFGEDGSTEENPDNLQTSGQMVSRVAVGLN